MAKIQTKAAKENVQKTNKFICSIPAKYNKQNVQMNKLRN